MKTLLTSFLIVLSFCISAQTPEQISYQAVARNSSGQVIQNQMIGIKLDLRQGSAAGAIVFSETHNKITNQLGLFTLGIGSVNTVAFSAINWENGPMFLEVSIDPNGGSSYTSMGAQQLLSVPYALYAKKAAGVNLNAGSGISINSGTITNTAPNQTVNISGSGVTGSYPNYTVTATNSFSTNISSGNSNLNVNKVGTDFTLTTVTPTLDVIGGSITGAYPSQTLTIPNGISYTSGIGISITSGTVITNTAPNQTVNINGDGATSVLGTYPNYTVSSIASPTTTLLQGDNILLNQFGNTYTISAPGYSISLPAGNIAQITNGISTSTALISPTNLSLGGVNNNLLSAGGNTISLNTYSAGNGIAISGSAPNLIISNLAPAITPTISGTGVATVNNVAPNYTVNVPMSTYNNNSGVFTTGTQTMLVAPTLSIVGNVLRSGPPSNTVTITIPTLSYTPTSSEGTIFLGTQSAIVPNYTLTNNSNTITLNNGFATSSATIPIPILALSGTTLQSGPVTNSVNLSSINNWSVTNGIIYPSTLTNSVGVGINSSLGGRVGVSHTSSSASPHINLISPTLSDFGRVKFSNTGSIRYFSLEARNNSGGANDAFNIAHNNGTDEKQVFLINGNRNVFVNNLNLPLAAFHVMTSTATPQGGVATEGFGQGGELNIIRNNNPGAGNRTAVLGGQEIGKVNFAGFDGSTYGDGAKIYAKATQNVTSSNKGTELIFAAVPSGTNTSKEVFKINGNGNLEIIAGLQIPFNAIAGKVLTSDAAGNASWQSPSNTSPWIQGVGTVTLANITDKVGIGIINPNASLHINSNANSDGLALDLNNTSNGSNGLQLRHFGIGNAAYLEVNNQNSNARVIEAQSNGIGQAIKAVLTNTLNSSILLDIEHRGTGKAAFFSTTNASNSSRAVDIISNGSGAAIGADNSGTGSAAVFNINNSASTASALQVGNSGLGSTIYASNSSATGRAIEAIANSGQAIYATNSSSTSPTFYAENTGISNVVFLNASNGRALFARNTSTLGNSVVEIESNGNGTAMQVYKNSGSTGSVASFANFSSTNSNDAVIISNNGAANSLYVAKPVSSTSGNVAKFENIGSGNSADAVMIINNGAGAAIKATSTSTAAGSTNVSVWLENGHLKSTQTTANVIGSGANTTTATVTRTAATGFSTTDVSGAVNINLSPVSNIATGQYIEFRVTYAKPYSIKPKVIATCQTYPLLVYVSSTSLTDCMIVVHNIGPTISSVSNVIVNYFIIE